MSVTLEQKYDAARKLLGAQVDAFNELAKYDEKVITAFARHVRDHHMHEWLAVPGNEEVWDALGHDLVKDTMDEINAELNATEQGYPSNV